MKRNAPCLLIAEVAQAHDGSLGTAHAYIEAAARAGVDAIKFQTHYADAESSSYETWRIRFSRQDATRYEYWQRMEFSEAQWKELRDHAISRGLRFLSSPFSKRAVELLRRVGVDAWKVASGEISNPQLFPLMAESGLPIYVSTGMSSWPEIDGAVERLEQQRVPYVLLQCTSVYPCPAEKVGVNVLAEFRRRYGCAVGLSDHSGTIYPSLAAVAMGAEVVEVHLTFSRECFGPDVESSLTTEQLRQLVEGVRFLETAMANPVDKDQVCRELQDVRRLFTKSIVAEADLPAGTVLNDWHVGLRKPGTGLPADLLGRVVGQRLARAVTRGQFLAEEDFASPVMRELQGQS